ncbi:polyprenol monophosphomannose synthase [Leifsonia shinshuensis]|uniref:polyprenol monophosphomannose synthase n=1 Tax=Leifsonia shinshuensis TaxID=150026 RepID=UPI00285E26FE|nr:polyprenol monophosphomannose synthase [Leifsonia shinshuensis]MDR6972088.1 dolichol-phosphate mannosyltransferase [Leifsonia shinshuensis]
MERHQATKGNEVERTLVVIPTYNERDNLATVVARVRRSVPGIGILVVDDGSPDGTGDIADALAAADDRIHVLHRRSKEGLGAAYRAGMRFALDAGYEAVVEMDADGSHRPEELGTLLAALRRPSSPDGADLVLGSRWVPGGGTVNWPLRRRMLSRGGSAYARIALGVPARDITGGYRAFTAEALRRIRIEEVQSQGYCFQIDMARRAFDEGLRIVEVPITFVERELGASKMTGGIVLEAMARVTRWGIERRTGVRGTSTRPLRESVAQPVAALHARERALA